MVPVEAMQRTVHNCTQVEATLAYRENSGNTPATRVPQALQNLNQCGQVGKERKIIAKIFAKVQPTSKIGSKFTISMQYAAVCCSVVLWHLHGELSLDPGHVLLPDLAGPDLRLHLPRLRRVPPKHQQPRGQPVQPAAIHISVVTRA